MRESLRKSGIDVIGNVPWGTHFCQFYQTWEDLIDILIPYFKAGLENNELCVWIVSQPLEVEEAKKALRKDVTDFETYLERGQIEIIPYTHGYLKEGIFDPERVVNSWVEKIDQALAKGYDGLRAAGDNRWLEKEGWNGFVDYENKVDAIINKHHVIALCPYYLDVCSTAEVIDVVSNHQFALIKREGKWERIENSGRKKAEKEAIQAAKNWRYTFDAVPDLIAIIDDKCRVVRANRSMAARLGLTPEECAGLTCYHALHGTDNLPSFCPHQQLLKDGAEHTAEVFEDYLGGYFSVSASPLHDSEGKLIGSVYVAHDINERKKVEERLKESEEKYRNIVETANEGILIIDAEVRITYANKKITEMLGYSLEELIGRFLWDFADEEGRAILKPNLEKRRQGINEVYELKLICKDGSPLWALVSPKALFNKEGGFTGSLGMFNDITERKQEEHRIRRYNRILEGINRIFSNVVQAKTEEELGETCLSVALEVTGSQFGFINEMGADRLLYDIAKSELAWERCLMYDKTGHRSFPSYFAVHGLYGSVINNEKGFFTNDPSSHPDSIGVPSGHPPLTSFLGVPLILEGKTVGLIAVANRESGYSYEQQSDLENLVPAVVQALQRKKAEVALKKARDNLEKLVEERTEELEKAYESLKESEKGLAEAQKMAHIGNWDWDIAADKAYWSEEMYRIFGRDPQKPAPPYNEYLSYIHPDDREYFDNAAMGAVNGKPCSIDHRIVLVDGEVRTVHIQSEVVFDKENIPIRIRGIVQDITESKRIEGELESVARLPQENPDPVMRLSQGRIINYANPSAQVLLTDWGSAISKEAPAEITEPSVAALGDGIRRKLECTYANRTYMIDIAPFPVAGYVNLYAHDITESKKAKEALEKIDKIRIKEIHHRIKNNLQVISSLLNLQAERFRNKEVLEAFRESQDRVTSMSLIHEELYKGEKNDTLNFSAYLQKLAESLFQTYSLKSKNVRLCTDLEENTLFNMDIAVPLGIIVNELISNSLKHAFTEGKEGEIRIKLCREEQGNEMHKSFFSLTISDNGKGIPENIKLESLESLGLQLVNILVDQLNGKIELKRTHGTEFRITFSVTERS
jgi:PAS domain S-box-containing protein